MPQLDANQLSALQAFGLLMSAIVWLATAGCTIRYFYLFFVRTSEFAALPHDDVLHHALRPGAQGAGLRGAHALALRAGAFVGTLCCLFYAAAAALAWVPRGWTVFGEDQGLWVGYIAAAVLALVATSAIHSGMIKLARRYADLERRR
jgi:hypothetical protein